MTSESTSKDGKEQRKLQSATTAGIQEFDNGVSKFAAANEIQVFKHEDDDKSKTFGGTSKSCLQEQSFTGDENNFQTSSSKTTSSSSHTVKQFSSDDYNPKITTDRNSQFDSTRINETDRCVKNISSDNTILTSNQSTSSDRSEVVRTNDADDRVLTSRVVKTYNSSDPNLPDYAKNSIVDGTTTIITEKYALQDGSTVTKTKFSTVGPEVTEKDYKTTNKNFSDTGNDEFTITSNIKITTTPAEDFETETTNYSDKRQSMRDTYSSERQDRTRSDDYRKRTSNLRKSPAPESNDDYKSKKTSNLRKSPAPESNDDYQYRKVRPENDNSDKLNRSEVDKNHYQTTYNKEFTSKRITVDTSASHDAFAKSLRTTPERMTPHRHASPEKSPIRQSKFGSSDTITLSSRTSPYPRSYSKSPRESPERKIPSRNSPDRKSISPSRDTPRESIYKTDYCSDTLKRQTVSSRQRINSREPSPTKSRGVSPLKNEKSKDGSVPKAGNNLFWILIFIFLPLTN